MMVLVTPKEKGIANDIGEMRRIEMILSEWPNHTRLWIGLAACRRLHWWMRLPPQPWPPVAVPLLLLSALAAALHLWPQPSTAPCSPPLATAVGWRLLPLALRPDGSGGQSIRGRFRNVLEALCYRRLRCLDWRSLRPELMLGDCWMRAAAWP